MLNVYTSLSPVTTRNVVFELFNSMYVADDQKQLQNLVTYVYILHLPMKTTVSISIAARILLFSWSQLF